MLERAEERPENVRNFYFLVNGVSFGLFAHLDQQVALVRVSCLSHRLESLLSRLLKALRAAVSLGSNGCLSVGSSKNVF